MQGYNIVVDGWAGASNFPHYGQTNRRTVGQMDNDSYKVRNKDRNGAKKSLARIQIQIFPRVKMTPISRFKI